MLRYEIIEIFIKVDDFCKEIQPILEVKQIENRKLGIRNLKQDFVKRNHQSPDIISYWETVRL